MRKQLVVAAIIGTVALAGCAKRRIPPSVSSDAAPLAAGTASEYSQGDAGQQARLQADLARSAGSDRVLFELDSHDLTQTARQILNRQVIWLRAHPGISFTVEGHCDERGTREYNLALGERRAKSAADFLVAQGIELGRIRTISYGKERPERVGSDEGSYAQNRRAVSIAVQGS